MEIVSADELEVDPPRLAARCSSEIGMDFTLPEARDMLKKAGAEGRRRARALRPRDDRGADGIGAVANSPSMRATPRTAAQIGGNRHRLRHGGSPPNCSDMDGGRRTGNHADYRNFLKLAQYFNCIGFLARLSGRADRHPCLDPPSRSAARHGGADRQAVPRLFAGQRAHLRRDRDRPHRPRHHRTSSWSASPRSSPSSTPTRR